MTASTRRELRSAATSTSTTAIGLIRALTDARPIKPTSTRCLSARRPNPGRGSTYRREILFRQPQPPNADGGPASHRISNTDAPVLPIQIERHWQDSAASAPRPPRARCFAEATARDRTSHQRIPARRAAPCADNRSQLLICPVSHYTAAGLSFIVPRVLELSYTSCSMTPFARDLGYEGP